MKIPKCEFCNIELLAGTEQQWGLNKEIFIKILLCGNCNYTKPVCDKKSLEAWEKAEKPKRKKRSYEFESLKKETNPQRGESKELCEKDCGDCPGQCSDCSCKGAR